LIMPIVLALIFSVELLIRFVPPETEARWLGGWQPIETTEPEDPDEVAAAQLLADLARRWPDASYTFRLSVMEEEAPNALALPGGLIVVTDGLLDSVQSENALAFVLAHELGHFRHRDHIRQLGRGAAIGLFLAGVRTSRGSGISVTLADLTLRGFGRKQETAADAFALDLVRRHYGHVGESLAFFETLADEEGDIIPWTGYLATHPATADRVSTLRELASGNGWTSQGVVRPWPPKGER
ncbi:MAG: M48 family metallopeptidase, partial [Pseudomonadota bacterium]